MNTRGNGQRDDTKDRILRWAVISSVTALLVSAGACAQGDATFDDDDDDGTSTSSTGTGGAGGEGGTTSSGTGGNTGPCDLDCSLIETPVCQVSQCNEATGQCEVVPDVDNTVCDDGVFCTVDDACVSGLCVGGPANDCGMTAPACEEVICSEDSQACATQPLANGSACTPTDLCQEGATCTNGLCVGQTKDCFFSPVPNDCYVSVCNPQNGQCEPEPGNFGQGCVDANDLCTDGKTCDQAGNCVGGGPMDCSAQTVGCFDGVCDVNTGQCVQQPINPGDPCQEAVDDCNNGQCDVNGICQPVPTNENGACEDGNPCTSGEYCTSGTCGNGQMVQQVIHFQDDFANNSQGWTLGTEWQIGPATLSSGESYGNPDPATDHTPTSDNGVAGVVIGGNAGTTLHTSFYYLTSPPFDVSGVTGTLWLGFYRWLNSDYTPFMQNHVQVYDGAQWVTLWESGGSPGVQDNAWVQQAFDLGAYKSNQMQIRFGFNVDSTGVYTVSQWNVDDVVVANVVCP